MAGELKVQTVFFIVTVIVVNNLAIHECMMIHNKEAPSMSTFYFSLQSEQGRAHISLLVLSVAP